MDLLSNNQNKPFLHKDTERRDFWCVFFFLYFGNTQMHVVIITTTNIAKKNSKKKPEDRNEETLHMQFHFKT